MKRFGAFLFVSTLLLTGCDKDKKEETKIEETKKEVVCTGEIKEGNTLYAKVEVTGNLEKNKTTSADVKLIFETESDANDYCKAMGFVSGLLEGENIKIDYQCDGKVFTMKNYEKLSESENAEVVNMTGLTKDEFEKALNEQFETEITCK